MRECKDCAITTKQTGSLAHCSLPVARFKDLHLGQNQMQVLKLQRSLCSLDCLSEL